ncbi:putative acetyltransferase [Paenibacillus konkukensis]|uniref:Acetyltransferase n=1 Tax=Paenibacillus konkukensis TaxID=2020716 RepID=A0ABY4RNS6_9BACL|nr:GNAT family N-acetyltransferase [Paenibacillus konkukensis]UQZ83605.1 putative acetyltransferase [Paenibacillus konkukensis]
MIRKRIPRQDDRIILELVDRLLVPFARKTQPDIRIDLRAIRERLKDCSTFVSASGGRAANGFIALRKQREAMYVDMLAVSPRAQGKGIGSRLLEHAERQALLAGRSEVRLWVDDANAKAQSFYTSRHYIPIQYNETIRCYLMSKQLE